MGFPILSHYKPSILGHPHFWKPLYTPISFMFLVRYSVYHMLISAPPSIAPRLDKLRKGTMQVRSAAWGIWSGYLLRDWILSNINKSGGRMGKGAFTLPTSVFPSFLGHGTSWFWLFLIQGQRTSKDLQYINLKCVSALCNHDQAKSSSEYCLLRTFL